MHPYGAPIDLDTLHGIAWMADELHMWYYEGREVAPGLCDIQNHVHQIIDRLEDVLSNASALTATSGERSALRAIRDAIGEPAPSRGVAVELTADSAAS